MPDGDIITNDLPLAALWAMYGFIPEMSLGDRKRVLWTLPAADVTPQVTEIVSDYKANRSRVEPKQFFRSVGYIRSSMYDFLESHGIGHKPSGS